MRKLLCFLMLLLGLITNGQELVFRERNKIFLKTAQIKVIRNIDSIEHKKDILFDIVGNVISYKKEKSSNYEAQKSWCTFVTNYIEGETKNKLTNLNSTYANVTIENNLIFFYPMLYNNNVNKDFNDFFKNHKIFIELEDYKPIKITFNNLHIGLLTIPFKLYFNSNDDRKGNNFVTDGNLMMYTGYRYGYTKYLKLPHKKEIILSKTAFSANYLLGISKISMDENNSYGNGVLFKGDVASLTTGFSGAMHYKEFSAMLAVGCDFPFDHKQQWIFNTKPWIGLGFGFELFKLISNN